MLRATTVFLAGLAVGATMHARSTQDARLPGVNGVNHLAIVTDKYDEMMAFYTKTLGFAEAFTIRNAAGEPTLTYLQASRSTFIELSPARAGRESGFTHYGVHVDDVNATAARLRERGMTVGTPRTIGSGSIAVTVTDPTGTRIELSELPPNAPARLAMERWK
jgi:predicted enzyme related to lactoylglutathione lyase